MWRVADVFRPHTPHVQRHRRTHLADGDALLLAAADAAQQLVAHDGALARAQLQQIDRVVDGSRVCRGALRVPVPPGVDGGVGANELKRLAHLFTG